MFPALLVVGAAFFTWERLSPARPLPAVPNFPLRSVLFTMLQGLIAYGVGPLFHAGNGALLPLGGWHPLAAGGLAYFVSTFVWYWWHRFRHEKRALWLGLHQLHHSPARIEVMTAFYKHPLEQLANAILGGLVAGPLFGLPVAATAVLAVLAFAAECIYHTNVQTPRWLGWFVQRPEMHRVHHARGRHNSNYGDLPLWDWLFGTLDNPARADGPCGFEGDTEERVGDMLLFRDVLAAGPRPRSWALTAVTALALSAMLGAWVEPLAPAFGKGLSAVGKLTMVAPFPKVFCQVGGVEPWAWEHTLTLRYADGHEVSGSLDRAGARRLAQTPYAWRNAYGAAVVYGPWLPAEAVASVLRHGACETRTLPDLAGAPPDPVSVTITSSPRPGLAGTPRTVELSCP